MPSSNMEFLQWSCQDVATWIESLGFPQYKACFTENLITGRKLIYVNCISLPRLGITDFKDMKVITARVRELLGITETPWSRSIADPPQDSVGLFLEKVGRTGQRADEALRGCVDEREKENEREKKNEIEKENERARRESQE